MEDTVTLRQGLEIFHQKYNHNLSHNIDHLPDEAKAFFKSHDIAHVIFGCDISLYGEGTVKIWTIFGTTLGFWKHISGYQDANAFQLSKKFTFADISRNILKLLFSIPKIIIRAKQMHQPWNWTEYKQYLDSPLSEIRKEFNIKILK